MYYLVWAENVGIVCLFICLFECLCLYACACESLFVGWQSCLFTYTCLYFSIYTFSQFGLHHPFPPNIKIYIYISHETNSRQPHHCSPGERTPLTSSNHRSLHYGVPTASSNFSPINPELIKWKTPSISHAKKRERETGKGTRDTRHKKERKKKTATNQREWVNAAALSTNQGEASIKYSETAGSLRIIECV